jgi:serine/threonine-protein kinase RsbW
VATCLVAVWDRDEATLALASAGHLPQLLVTDGAARLLDTTPDPPLGVARPGPPHPSLRVEIDRGATLVLFTDGLVERRDVAIDEALAGLGEVVQSCGTLDVDALTDRLIDIDGGDDDDVAVLAVEIPARRRDD